MERTHRLVSYIFILLFSLILFAQTNKDNIESTQLPLKETEQRISTLSFVDLQNTMTELNLIRTKLDEQTDQLSKNCSQLTDKNKASECFLEARNNLKKLWTDYFSAKEKYLNFLYQHFLQENSKQAKTTLDFIESLQGSKSRR